MRFSENKDEIRCPLCYMHRDLCICEEAPEIYTKTRWELMFHISEIHRSTWTGRILVHSLMNLGVHIRGLLPGFQNRSLENLLLKNQENQSKTEPLPPLNSMNLPGQAQYSHTLILYPDSDSVSFYDKVQKITDSAAAKDQSIPLFRILVPDGNWNQASRMVKREILFRNALQADSASTVFIKPQPIHRMRDFLRKDHVATAEAVIHILPFLETNGDHKAALLLDHYERLVNAVSKSRGR